jgi:thymidylate synthase (FAD)
MSETVIFRDDVSVELIKSSASDADVIWAARVSTAGELSLDEIGEDPARSAGLINYLARERHGSPFEHTSMTFFVSAPIFISHQRNVNWFRSARLVLTHSKMEHLSSLS